MTRVACKSIEQMKCGMDQGRMTKTLWSLSECRWFQLDREDDLVGSLNDGIPEQIDQIRGVHGRACGCDASLLDMMHG
jgi:hypothetical protein